MEASVSAQTCFFALDFCFEFHRQKKEAREEDSVAAVVVGTFLQIYQSSAPHQNPLHYCASSNKPRVCRLNSHTVYGIGMYTGIYRVW